MLPRRRDDPERHQGGAGTDQGDEDRRSQGTSCDSEGTEALEHAEDPCHEGVGDHPRQQREGRDVDDRVADTDDAGDGERDDVLRNQAHHCQRHAPQGDPDRQPPSHPAAPHQRGAGDAADDRTDAHGPLEHAHGRVVPPEQVDGQDDDEHAERATDRRLQRNEADDDRHPVVRPDRMQPFPDLADEVSLGAILDREALVAQPEQQRRREQAAGSGEDEDRRHVGDGHEDGGDQRPDNDTERVERAAGDVDGRQLLRRTAQRRHQCRVTGPERRERDGGHDRQQVDDRRGPAPHQHRAGRQGGDAAHQARDHEHALPGHPVGVRRDDRREQRGRKQSQHPDQAGGEGTAVRVGHEHERDRERPLGGVRRAEGEQRADERAVAQKACVHGRDRHVSGRRARGPLQAGTAAGVDLAPTTSSTR